MWVVIVYFGCVLGEFVLWVGGKVVVVVIDLVVY